jgi:glycosyltransferase involved in cell wall biosynthesis
MRIALATDAWLPQVNGVVTTLARTREELTRLGHEVFYVTPEGFRTAPLPSYPEIRMALFPGRRIATMLDAFAPDAIHIATEGTIGLATRAYCVRRNLPFTTAYHTRFPEYVRLRTRLPLKAGYALSRWFHGRAARTMVATASLREELEAWGFRNLAPWSRGVDGTLFRPRPRVPSSDPRPVYLYCGRVAIEKNIEAFLSLDLPGTKVVVGDGPDLAMLRRKYPDARFTGYRKGEALAQTIAQADVFVFPSRTDTFGIVLIEAMACGVPVAAFPVPGPIDVIEDGVTGILSEDLHTAAVQALNLSRHACVAAASRYTWEASARQFLSNLEPVRARVAGIRTSHQTVT